MFVVPYSSFPGSFLSLSLFCCPFVVDYVMQRSNSSNSSLFCFPNAQSWYLKLRGEPKCIDVVFQKKRVNIVRDPDFGDKEMCLWRGFSSADVCEIRSEGCRPV